MVRAEDGTVFGSLSDARTTECRVCGKKLNFKDANKDEGFIAQAKHCGSIYTIGTASNYTISAARDPKFVEKENKLIENQGKANKLRRDGKAEEAAKQDEQNQRDAAKLAEEEDTDEPKTAFNPRAESSREEEKSKSRR